MAKNIEELRATISPERQAKINERVKQELAKMEKRTMSVFKLLAQECGGESYTGRGMNKPCLAFICSSIFTFIPDALDIIQGESGNIQEYLEEFSDAIRRAATDNMGMRMIIYFPHIHGSILDSILNEEEEEEEEDEEEEGDE